MTRRTLERREYEIRLVTPAFLGGADQRAEWRTPPIKALVRPCLRIVLAAACNYDWRKVRQREGELLGHAWLKTGGSVQPRRSQVELALSDWKPGTLKEWPQRDPKAWHPEVAGGRKIGAHLYLGYGPLTYQKGTGTTLKQAPALEPGARTTLHLRFPPSEANRIQDALELMDLLGTLGGRSRNGWGSIELLHDGKPLVQRTAQGIAEVLRRYARPLHNALDEEWPHAIGKDQRGLLVWWTRTHEDWPKLMKHVAELKIGYRTRLQFPKARGPHQDPQDRHILAYPVTNHEVKPWGKQKRLANQLRIKVLRTQRGLRAMFVHIPTRLPKSLASNARHVPNEQAVWQKVHEYLDVHLHRIDRVRVDSKQR